jgi:hypothetical protein
MVRRRVGVFGRPVGDSSDSVPCDGGQWISNFPTGSSPGEFAPGHGTGTESAQMFARSMVWHCSRAGLPGSARLYISAKTLLLETRRVSECRLWGLELQGKCGDAISLLSGIGLR